MMVPHCSGPTSEPNRTGSVTVQGPAGERQRAPNSLPTSMDGTSGKPSLVAHHTGKIQRLYSNVYQCIAFCKKNIATSHVHLSSPMLTVFAWPQPASAQRVVYPTEWYTSFHWADNSSFYSQLDRNLYFFQFKLVYVSTTLEHSSIRGFNRRP